MTTQQPADTRPDGAPQPGHAVDDLRDRLATLDDVALEQRPALFEHANEVLADALAELEEV